METQGFTIYRLPYSTKFDKDVLNRNKRLHYSKKSAKNANALLKPDSIRTCPIVPDKVTEIAVVAL